jgi:hypothetical protein
MGSWMQTLTRNGNKFGLEKGPRKKRHSYGRCIIMLWPSMLGDIVSSLGLSTYAPVAKIAPRDLNP